VGGARGRGIRIAQFRIHYFENVGHTWYNITEKCVTVPGSELSLARQKNPVLLKDGLQFFFIKQGSSFDSVPNYRPFPLIQ
jgi:hypothetical protein